MRPEYIRYSILLLFIPILFQACLDSSESSQQREIRLADEAIQEYLQKNNIDAEKQQSGVYIKVLNENAEGKQVVNDHVAGILYTMNHLEGEYEIESHSDSLNPMRFSYSFTRDSYSLYPAGLNIEIGKMRLGETFRFYIPSYQAFSNYSHEDFFDAHSHFVVDVELVELKTEDEIYFEELESVQSYIEENYPDAESYPNGLYHVTLEEGNGPQPGTGSQVEIEFTRTYLNGTEIESEKVQVFMNNNQLVRGLEDGLLLMREGEKAKLIMPSRIAFGKSIQVIPQSLRELWVEDGNIYPATRPFSPVIYEVELLNVN